MHQVRGLNWVLLAVVAWQVETERMTTDQQKLIATDSEVLGGQAVLAGTRVPVSVILDCLAVGMTSTEILAEYPSVTETGIRAAAAYGALLARDELIPLPIE